MNDYNLKTNEITAVVGVLKLDKRPEIKKAINSKVGKRFRKIMGKDFRKYDENLDFLQVPVDDIETEDISRYFVRVVKFIDTCTKNGRNVVVFCNKGLSRSPSMILAYLIWKYDIDYEEAKEIVLEERKRLKINRSFENQLIEWRIFTSFNFGFMAKKDVEPRDVYE